MGGPIHIICLGVATGGSNWVGNWNRSRKLVNELIGLSQDGQAEVQLSKVRSGSELGWWVEPQ